MVQREITRIKAVSVSKLVFILGMIQGIFVVPTVVILTPGGFGSPVGSLDKLVALLLAITIFAVVISISSFISAILYNIASSIIGGLTVTLTDPSKQQSKPSDSK